MTAVYMACWKFGARDDGPAALFAAEQDAETFCREMRRRTGKQYFVLKWSLHETAEDLEFALHTHDDEEPEP